MYFVVEIDFSMGTKVFGYRDLKNGKFQPRSNYSFRIEAFCDGKRYRVKRVDHLVFLFSSHRFSHPSWLVTVFDREYTTSILLPDNLDRLREITTYISGVLKRPVYADLPEK